MAFYRQDLATDFGTANTVIFKDDQVVLEEASITELESKTDALNAIGKEAQQIEKHAPPRQYTVWPLMNRVIEDYDAAEDPLKAVARGTCLALKGTDNYPFLMK